LRLAGCDWQRCDIKPIYARDAHETARG
jgi:hypothetical protein